MLLHACWHLCFPESKDKLEGLIFHSLIHFSTIRL